MNYLDECKRAMEWLGKKKDTIFLGQTVEYPGSAMFRSLENVSKKKRKEMPVAEDMQMGMSIGLSLEGFVPISIYPRMDFLICAVNQLINHLDKIEESSHGEFTPGVIIRTQIGNTKPLYPGLQHCGDYCKMLSLGLKNIRVVKINYANSIEYEYINAYNYAKQGISTILIEMPQGSKEPNKK